MDWDGLPTYEMPPSLLGSTKRHRQQDILIGCLGKTYELGWILFGKDGSLYFHRRGRLPITEIGMAVNEGGKLIDIESTNILSLPIEYRIGAHLSLHSSGKVHVKSGRGRKLCVGNIGAWLPVQQAFIFAHVFTEPVGNLPETPTKAQMARLLEIQDPLRSLRLDIIIAPLNEKVGKAHVPFLTSTIFLGFSPRYAVLVNAQPHAACNPRIFFLSRS